MSENKWVYAFGANGCDGDASMRNLLGGKGANLAEMASIGLPVPPGFTITTEVCTYYYDNEETYPDELRNQVLSALKQVELHNFFRIITSACGGYPYAIKSLRIKSRRGISLLLYKRILSLPLKKMYVICPYFS